jgi:translation initiation factor IF-1
MGWANYAIEALQDGKSAQIRPRGHSMRGKVNDGDLVTVEPCEPQNLKSGDIVLVKVKRNVYLHLVKAIDGGRILIGNNRGGINGWVGPNAVYGIAAKIEARK